MTLDKSTNIVDEIIKIFKDEIHKVIDDNPDVFTEDILKIFDIKQFPNLVLYGNDLLWNKPRTTRYGLKQIRKSLIQYLDIWAYVPFKASMEYTIKDDKTNLKSLCVYINKDSLNETILDNIHRIDVLTELVKIDARHEMGHMIDFIKSIDLTPEEFQKRDISDAQSKNEYYKWRREILDEYNKTEYSIENENKTNRMISEKYYNLPAEWRADVLGRVDRQAYLDLMYDTSMDQSIEIGAKNKEDK